MNRREAARFNAERRAMVLDALDRGITTTSGLAAEVGIKRNTMSYWVREHAPDLRHRIEFAGRGRPAAPPPADPPPTRSIPYRGKPGVRIIPSPDAVWVCCGTCRKAWPRPTRRRAQQYLDLHQRLHPLILKEG